MSVPGTPTSAGGSTPPQRGGPLSIMNCLDYVAHEHAAFALGIAGCAPDAIIGLSPIKKTGLWIPTTFGRQIWHSTDDSSGRPPAARNTLGRYRHPRKSLAAGQLSGPALQTEMRSVVTLAMDVALETTTNAFCAGAGSAAPLRARMAALPAGFAHRRSPFDGQ